ncbi:MAG: exosortase [Planctomycetota bacterium]|jgi:exosortase
MKPFLCVFLPLLVAYTTALFWCADRWNAPTEYFTHCWLVPFVGALAVWSRRKTWQLRPRETDLRGLWLLVPGLMLHFAGAALMIDSWSASSIALTLPGAAWLALGTKRLHGLWPVLLLVLFAIPMPIYVEGRMAFVLKEIAVGGGSWLANLVGADIVREGDHLVPQGIDGSLLVAAACGGLRSLLAMLTLAYCLVFFTGPPSFARRALLLLVAAPLAVAANVVRIAALCLLARWFGVPFAEGTGHSIANVVEWAALLVTMVSVDGLLARRLGKSGKTVSRVAEQQQLAMPSATSLRGPAIVLWLLAAPLLWLSCYRPFNDRSGRAEQIPATIAGYRLEPRTAAKQLEFEELLPSWRELLGTKDFVWRRYRDSELRVINLVALFHDTNWKSVHPPRICIEGSDMVIEQDDLVRAPWLDGDTGSHAVASRIVAKRRSDGWRFVTLSMFGTESWASGDYWDFTMHHLPLAVLRQNESGFLLRVESPIYLRENASQAEARCREFLEQLMPAARKLVR